MSVGLRAVWPLFLGVLMLNLGHGLQGSLVSLKATALDFTATTTGVVMAGFYVGLFTSSIVAPPIIGKVGHIRVFAAFASLVSTAILLMPLWPNPVWWFAMRVVVGICIAGLSIVAESWLNAASSNQDRGKMLSIYMIIAYGSAGAGQFLLNVADPSGFVRFIVVSALLSLALVPISLARVQAPAIETPKPVAVLDVYRLSPLAFFGTFAAGLAQSAFFAMGPIYGLGVGLSLVEISTMMALPALAVILSQYPVGALSDRFDRRIVMTVLTFASFAVASAAFAVPDKSAVLVIALLAVFGAVSFPIYSLAMAHANDYLESDQMLGASAKLVLIYGVGAILGPAISGMVMQASGTVGFMVYLALVHGSLGVYALARMLIRPDTPDETGEFIPVAPQATPVVAQVVAEEYEYDEIAEEGAQQP
jgi:MFS family permease